MNIKFVSALALTALLAACAGTPKANDTSAADRATIDNATDSGTKMVNEKGEQLICRREAKVGSRLARDTICMTQAEWSRVSAESQRTSQSAVRAVAPPQGK